MTSPGTSSLALTCFHFLSLSTLAFRASFFFSNSMALSALCSCQKLTTAFNNSRARMIKKSSQCLMTAEMIAAISIIQGMGDQKFFRNLINGWAFFSVISFGPYSSRRFVTSWPSRPASELFSSENSSSIFISFSFSGSIIFMTILFCTHYYSYSFIPGLSVVLVDQEQFMVKIFEQEWLLQKITGTDVHTGLYFIRRIEG